MSAFDLKAAIVASIRFHHAKAKALARIRREIAASREVPLSELASWLRGRHADMTDAEAAAIARRAMSDYCRVRP